MPRNKDLKQVLAENVRAVMSTKKLSQPQVAALAKQNGHKIDQTTVGRIARGDIPTTVETLTALAAGLGYEPWQLLVPNITLREPGAEYKALSDEALEVARAFDQMQPQTKERIREHVFIYSMVDRSFPWLRSGRPVSENYASFEKWHEENRAAQLALEAARISKLKPAR